MMHINCTMVVKSQWIY